MEMRNICLIIFALALFSLIYIMIFNKPRINLTGIRVDWSKTKNGRGVFANQDFKKGDVVENAPFIVINKNDCSGLIRNYTFEHFQDKTKILVVLGYGMLYNHDDNHNIGYFFDKHNSILIFKALRDIKKDEELYDSYGKDWWSKRNFMMKY
jgi:hypothetical protein